MNPPFHEGGTEDRDLGVAFVRAAAGMLRKGGGCWLVANRHLPYEAALAEAFSTVTVRGDAGGYKVIEARK
jgi:16S rRNA (guanine1207-N2)-methyltransferase